VRRAWRLAGDAAADVQSVPDRRLRPCQTSAGASTLCMIQKRQAGGSARSAGRKPSMIVCDNGTELISSVVLPWCGDMDVEWRLEGPCITAVSRALMAVCAKSYPTKRCSSVCATTAFKSQPGSITTNKTAHNLRLNMKPRRRSPPKWISNGLLR
jgi:hypothetical protein